MKGWNLIDYLLLIIGVFVFIALTLCDIAMIWTIGNDAKNLTDAGLIALVGFGLAIEATIVFSFACILDQ